MTIVVEVSDDRCVVSFRSKLFHDLRNCESCGIIIDRDTYDLGACICEFDDLSESRFDIASRSIGHRLDDDGMIRPKRHMSHHDSVGFATRREHKKRKRENPRVGI